MTFDEFMAMVYPANETDRLICMAAFAIIAQKPGILKENHLYLLLLIVHQNWCKKFLNNEDKKEFDDIVNSMPPHLFVGDNESIKYEECMNYLEQLQAISIISKNDRCVIGFDKNHKLFENKLLNINKMIEYASKAMERIIEIKNKLNYRR